MSAASPTLRLETYFRIDEIEASLWDSLSAGQPFQSHRWYAYAEQVMAGQAPFYILVYEGTALLARAAFYRVADEPLPLAPGLLRSAAGQFFRRWPLLICRSPFSGLSGLVIANFAPRAAVLEQVCGAALAQARAWQVSFVFFDFVERELTRFAGWPQRFRALMVNQPGTFLQIAWPDFEHYLSHLAKEERYHYRRIQRKARESGIFVTRHSRVDDLESALALIANVERKHTAAPVPWTRALLERLGQADATWLTAHVENRLVGCGLSLRDNGGQFNTALGLAEDVPYVYFALLYESLQVAFEQQVQVVRLGSGAYDVKRRLGFETENNNFIMAASPNFALQFLLDRMT
jgi:predicted N-acyltransferase